MMVSVRRAYAQGPFGQIHLRLAGTDAQAARPALICLHQSPKSGRDFERLIGVLGDRRHCVAPDTPGYGDSDAPSSPPAIADYGRAMLELIDRLQTDGTLPAGPVDLMGYHTGSAIAAWMGRHHPDRIRRIVFVSLPALDEEKRLAMLANIDAFPVPRNDGSSIMELWNLTQTLNDARLDANWRYVALGDCLRTGSRLPWGFRAVFDHDCLADLKAIGQPTLVFCPRDDLWDETQRHAASLLHSTFVELGDAGNGFLDLDTETVAHTIEQFLAV